MSAVSSPGFLSSGTTTACFWESGNRPWRSEALIILVMYGNNRSTNSVAYSNVRLRKNEETRLDALEIKWLRKILRVSWTAKKTNELVLNNAWVNRELLDIVEARKLAYYGHTMRKQGICLEKEVMQGTMPGARRRGRPQTAWMDNINTWTGLFVEESIRMTEDRDKWRKYINGVANPQTEDG